VDRLHGLLEQHGQRRWLSPGEVLIGQGAPSDGIYYLQQGRLGVYREEQDGLFLLSEVLPGELVGELGAVTGWQRTATLRAEEPSLVIHVGQADFLRAVNETPDLVTDVFTMMGRRLTRADIARVTLDRSYQQAVERVTELSDEKARLEETLRLREELADMIVHDLRNPLGVIAGGLHLLNTALESGTWPEYAPTVLDTIQRSVQRMRRLVDTLQDIASFEQQEMSLHRLPLNLTDLAEEAIAEEQPLALINGLSLESRLPADLPEVLADRDVILRVLINLLDNGLKFTPSGSQVWLEGRREGEEVHVEVLDTGPGIPPEERSRIFEKFTRVRGRSAPTRGTGLGLAFCAMAVTAHGGRIWVEDGPGGVGSRFVFTLPVAG